MPGKKQRNPDFNRNWESEISAYDEACDKQEREYREHFMVIKDSCHSALTEEENEILQLFLNGIPCNEIAEQYGIEENILSEMLEIIRAKLSLDK